MKIFWLSFSLGLASAVSHDEILEDCEKTQQAISSLKTNIEQNNSPEDTQKNLAQIVKLIAQTSSNISNLIKKIEKNRLADDFIAIRNDKTLVAIDKQIKAIEDQRKHTETLLRADIREAKKGNKVAVTMVCLACGAIIIFFGKMYYQLYYT